MSHFYVGVVIDAKDKNDVESVVAKMLAPYDENMEVAPYIDLTKQEIIDKAKKYQQELIQWIADRKIKRVASHDVYLNSVTDEDFYKAGLEYLGAEDNEIDENGNYLSTYNPNSKWDWWSLCQFAFKDDIVVIKNYKLYNDLSEEEVNKNTTLWKWFNNEIELTEEELHKLGWYSYYKNQYYVERFGSLENWLRDASINAPYALLNETGWHELGSMGWFGCDNTTPQQIMEYYDYLESYFKDPKNQDKLMVWVDCHI